jgi:hypothetical protein
MKPSETLDASDGKPGLGGPDQRPRCDIGDGAYRSPPATRTPHHHALRPRPQKLDRHPNYVLAAYMASGT